MLFSITFFQSFWCIWRKKLTIHPLAVKCGLKHLDFELIQSLSTSAYCCGFWILTLRDVLVFAEVVWAEGLTALRASAHPRGQLMSLQPDSEFLFCTDLHQKHSPLPSSSLWALGDFHFLLFLWVRFFLLSRAFFLFLQNLQNEIS